MEATNAKPLALQMKNYFGMGRTADGKEQTALQFVQEVKALSDKDKKEFADMLAGVGLPCT